MTTAAQRGRAQFGAAPPRPAVVARGSRVRPSDAYVKRVQLPASLDCAGTVYDVLGSPPRARVYWDDGRRSTAMLCNLQGAAVVALNH